MLLAALACVTAPASATELAEIDRRIAKEPTYRGKPKYCLLVFGNEAKFRVWLVQDGDSLYVDRDGTGDLTEKGNRVDASSSKSGLFELGTICVANDPDRTFHTHVTVQMLPEGVRVSLRAKGKVEYSAERTPGGPLRFAERAADAPIIHFDGPLTFVVYRAVLNKDQARVHFTAHLGTRGLGQGTLAIPHRRSLTALERATGVAEIEYASSEAGKKPLKVRGLFERDG
jgi:hypothetical protein